MKRKIIDINEEKCTGCGRCIPDCPEGALQLIEGKACLVSDLFCDGLGACMGTCPEGAIAVIEREAGEYDERAVMEKIVQKGPAVITAHLEHLLGHGEQSLYDQAVAYLVTHQVPVPSHNAPGGGASQEAHGGNPYAVCPGSTPGSIPRPPRARTRQQAGTISSELRHWPVQLKLISPDAARFDNSDLLIAADCVPFAFPDIHRDFLKDRTVVIFCPKLDTDIEGYITKLAAILSRHTVHSATTLHMEVPCCSGVTYVVDQAMKQSGKNVPLREVTISIGGEVVPSSEKGSR